MTEDAVEPTPARRAKAKPKKRPSTPPQPAKRQANGSPAIGDLQVEYVPLGQLKPYERNPRQHSPTQIDAIAASITAFGWSSPIVVDGSYGIVAGHGRHMAAEALGMATVPVVQLKHLTDQQRRALVIAENQIALSGGWNAELLSGELVELRADGFDLALLGFDESELFALTADKPVEGADPESTPEPPKVPVVERGDLWLLGNHRLLCGDATRDRVGTELADLIFTDPPYNVGYEGRGKNALGRITNDDLSREDFDKFLASVFENCTAVMRQMACIYVCHHDAASGTKLAFEKAFAVAFEKSATIIWVKNAASMGWQDYRSQHEPILYGWKRGKGKHAFFGDRTKTTIWKIDRDVQAQYKHPTQKPTALVQEAIKNSSEPGQIIYDPFVGSGTTIIAAEMTARRCIAIEIDPAYVQVAIERWQTFAGKQATLEGDGRTFDEIKNARQKKSGPKAARRRQGEEAQPA